MTINSILIREWGDEARARNEPEAANRLHDAAFYAAQLEGEIILGKAQLDAIARHLAAICAETLEAEQVRAAE